MKRLIVVIFSALLAACGGNESSDTETRTADLDVLYRNAVIWTGSDEVDDASLLGVRDGRIAFVGDGTGDIPAALESIDLQGQFVMPGFVDNHVHFLAGGRALSSVQLRDAASPEEFTERIATYARHVPDGGWILSGNWDHEMWGGELPRKDWIDEVTGDIPVFVTRMDSHMALANSAALELAGIDSASAAPEGGEIVKDADGEPTGILKDYAMDAVSAVIPEAGEEQLLAEFLAAQEHALSLGLTQVHSMTADPSDTGTLAVYRMAQASGLLKIRIVAYTPVEDWANLQDLVRDDGTGNEMLRWGGVKGMVDGSLGSTTAWFYDPYLRSPDTAGFPLAAPAELEERMAGADDAQLRVAIHAIGDRAIDELIASMRRIAGDELAERRYRIEHFQHPSFDAIAALADSDIIASMQPYHAIDDGRWAEDSIGPERAKSTYAFRSILDAGGILTFGSDWPVAPLSPLEGVYAAVTRRTFDGANPDGWQPQEKISVEEALTAYTSSNAYAVFEEQIAGTLEVGKRADFVVLSADPRTIDAAEINNINVLRTVVGGAVAYMPAE